MTDFIAAQIPNAERPTRRRHWLRERIAERRFPLSQAVQTEDSLGPYETRYEVRRGYPDEDRFLGR